MAVNEMTEGSGLNRVLSQAFGVQGAAAPFLATEVFPVLVMGNDRPEWKYLSDERLSMGRATDAATVGQQSSSGLKVDSTQTRTLAVVERIICAQTASTNQFLEVRSGRSATSDSTSKGFFRDLRFRLGNQPSADNFIHTTATPQGNVMGIFALPAAGQVVIEGPFVLMPGSYIQVTSQSTNTQVVATFIWREYAAAQGELRGV
ncbi:MAG: hypothetical protein OEN00_16210 [Gemmatimonadota bacterium]|nr:hypothetical protein [Gemmatimonadota bacterium]